MGLLIDHTYFTGILSVGLCPDTGAYTTTQEAERDLLESYIDVYEREYLERLLGAEMCASFVAYLEQDPPAEEEDRWEKLKGMLKEPYSPVACYVYMHYVGQSGRSVTRSGVVKSSADGDLVSALPLQARAWNLMAGKNRRISELLGGKEYEGAEPDPYLCETINELGI